MDSISAIAAWVDKTIRPGETFRFQKHTSGFTTVRVTFKTSSGEEYSEMHSPPSWTWHDVLTTLEDELPSWRGEEKHHGHN